MAKRAGRVDSAGCASDISRFGISTPSSNYTSGSLISVSSPFYIHINFSRDSGAPRPRTIETARARVLFATFFPAVRYRREPGRSSFHYVFDFLFGQFVRRRSVRSVSTYIARRSMLSITHNRRQTLRPHGKRSNA